MSDNDSTQRGEDAAFLYVLITFQFFVFMAILYKLFYQLFGSAEYKKEYKVSLTKVMITLVLLCVVAIWANNTYDLIQKESFMKGSNWNPFEILGLEVPTLAKSGFNTPEVKKAYR